MRLDLSKPFAVGQAMTILKFAAANRQALTIIKNMKY